MGYAEKRGKGDGTYYRGRYKREDGGYGTVSHPDGSVVKFARKLDAKRAADAEETEQAAATRQAAARTADGRITFAAYSDRWYAGLDLDEDTLDNYRSMLGCHLLGWFGEKLLDEITSGDISDWEDDQRARGYAPRSVRNRRNLLVLILSDAVDDPAVTLSVNVAARRRGRGRKADPLPARDDEDQDDEDDDEDEDDERHGKVITDPLGALLVAERAAVMSGRDDEFVLVITGFYTGMRWGELMGLETRFRVPRKIRVRWQLRERAGGRARKRPKFGKKRDLDTPAFLDRLLDDHTGRADPQPCACHGKTYVFSGLGRARGTRQAVTLAAVALDAGVSQATVSAALHRPATVAAATRARIGQAMERSGYRAGQAASRPPHLYRSGFGQWVWTPATDGWYPERSPMPRRSVPVAAEPWPGVPVRGRGNTARSDACWVPLAAGMTPHGLRHAHKSWMLQERVHEVLSHDRLGHEMPGIAGIYSQPTPPMRAELMEALTRAWEESLDARLALCPSSPVAVLDGLLRERAALAGGNLTLLRYRAAGA